MQANAEPDLQQTGESLKPIRAKWRTEWLAGYLTKWLTERLSKCLSD